MPTTTRSPRVRAIAALCAFGLLAVACGDDDDTEAATDDSATTVAEGEAASGGEFEEYCTAIAEMSLGVTRQHPPTSRAPSPTHRCTGKWGAVSVATQLRLTASHPSPLFG